MMGGGNMNWNYKGQTVDELSTEVIGFVYCIYYTDGTMYVGKKVARSLRRMKPLKNMRANARRMVMKEHDWKSYEGSSKLTEDKTIHQKVILHLCTNKRSMGYLEVKELFCRQAIESDKYVNENINGKWFSNCLDGVYTEEIGQQLMMEFNDG